jgi:predicted Zn-dependent protease
MTRLDKLQGMLEASPNDEFLNYALAMEYVSAGRSDEAVRAFERVISLDADHSAAFFQQAQVLARMGQIEAAKNAAAQGVSAAQKRGEQHAAEEISGFLASLG